MVQNSNTSSTTEVSWNLSQAVIYELQNLLTQATNNYIRGDPIKSYFCLKAVKMRVIASFKPEERKSLRKLEIDIAEQITQIRKEEDSLRKQELLNIFSAHYEFYNEKLIDLLDKYGYLISKKQETSRMF